MGKRGEGWVILQMVLFALVLLLPRWKPFAFPFWSRLGGLAILAVGGVLGTLGVRALGSNLTAVPKPKEDGYLVTKGIFSVVRHPIYSGLIFGTLGWSIWNMNASGLAMSLVLFFFFDQKSRREERWLMEAYPGYAAYRRNVKKLIPWLY